MSAISAGTYAAIAAFAVSTATGLDQARQSRVQNRAKRRIELLRGQRDRIRSLASARRRAAEIEANAAAGVQTSAAQGAIGAIQSQANSAVSFSNQVGALQGTALAAQGRANRSQFINQSVQSANTAYQQWDQDNKE